MIFMRPASNVPWQRSSTPPRACMRLFARSKGGNLRLSAAEAANIQMELQELVLQAAALGGVIREQQTGQAQLRPLR
jgi:hypothetical protein